MQMKNEFKRFMQEYNPLKPMTKVLTIIRTPHEYCQFIRLAYVSGYIIHHSCEHPRAITLPKGALGYIENRDVTATCYKFVIYGKTKRNHNNARIVYLVRGE